MPTRIRWMNAIRSFFVLTVLGVAAARAEFPLKDGDVWVMAGDSITAQHLHSNYFEAFCFARYPKMKFAFRNSGVSGHTIPTTLNRFDHDIAAWKPTVVSVELGMNDHGGTPTPDFIKNMGTMVERIRAIDARPVIFSASPINNGIGLSAPGGKSRLHEYALALKEFSGKENIPYADQFHALVDVWAANKSKESLVTAYASMSRIASDDTVIGVEHLRAFLKAQDAAAVKPVSMLGDPVHPGPTGQLMMAAALLSELGVDPFVSAATLDAGGKVAEAKGCAIDNIQAGDAGLAFDRLDERLPFPIPDNARAVVAFDPTILRLSDYTLKVTNLKPGNYAIKCGGVQLAVLSDKDLLKGVNLTALGGDSQAKDASPVTVQSQKILGAIDAKEGLVNQWRAISQRAIIPSADTTLKDQHTALAQKAMEADEKIRQAATPQKLRWEITKAP